MSGYLKYQARHDRPDVEELEKLANSVEEFTTCLIDPLKSDTREREAFGDSLDLIIDKAIEYNQGKVEPYLNICNYPVPFRHHLNRYVAASTRFSAIKSMPDCFSSDLIFCLLCFYFPQVSLPPSCL